MIRSNYKLLFIPTVVIVLFSILLASFLFDDDVDQHSQQQELVSIVGAVGPESFAFNPLGEGPFTGVSDGRIIKWEDKEERWIDFSVTSSNRNRCEGPQDEHICGRPLGLCFNIKSGDLYIADAYKGVLRVGPNGGVASEVATRAEGINFGFTNSLDIDQETGIIYFTDSSTLYQRRNYLSVILSEDKTGRLMSYNPETKQVTVLIRNLSFPNGVALSKDRTFILIAETTYCRVLKYWLKTPKAGTYKVIAKLPGFPDNIKRSPRGGFWVGVHSRRHKLVEWALSFSWTGKALMMLPVDVMRIYGPVMKRAGGGLGVRLSEDGDVLEMLEGCGKSKLRCVSEVEERNGKLWIGSVNMPFATVRKVEDSM